MGDIYLESHKSGHFKQPTAIDGFIFTGSVGDVQKSCTSEWASLPFLKVNKAPTASGNEGVECQWNKNGSKIPLEGFLLNSEEGGPKSGVSEGPVHPTRIGSFYKRSMDGLRSTFARPEGGLFKAKWKTTERKESIGTASSEVSVPPLPSKESQPFLWRDLSFRRLISVNGSGSDTSMTREASKTKQEVESSLASKPQPWSFRFAKSKPKEPKEAFVPRQFNLQPTPRTPSKLGQWWTKRVTSIRDTLGSISSSHPGFGFGDRDASSVWPPGFDAVSAIELGSVPSVHESTHDQSPGDAWSASNTEHRCFSGSPFQPSSGTSYEVDAVKEAREPEEVPESVLKVPKLRGLEWHNRRAKQRISNRTKHLVDPEPTATAPLSEAIWYNVDAIVRALSSAGSEVGMGEYPERRAKLRKERKQKLKRRKLYGAEEYDLNEESPFLDFDLLV
ncbi:hypothetical protein FT663_05075 [Candidozyma haemuli var. vulneris]|nr:hypothetical protein FT663_05075 [[Candida] haemuloni var. vulneris]KAF3991770.1 hypothetical protein FT662_01524 [[Candida] haemuloni var. vulneris]